LDEAKASSPKVREAGKAVTNRSILAEVRVKRSYPEGNRDTFLTQKKTKKERQKSEQAEVQKAKKPLENKPEAEEIELAAIENEPESEMPEVFDCEQMREDYGW
jgi:putative transposase